MKLFVAIKEQISKRLEDRIELKIPVPLAFVRICVVLTVFFLFIAFLFRLAVFAVDNRVPQVARDMVIVLVADRLDGDVVQEADLDNIMGSIYSPGMTGGVTTNSLWLWERAREIVPYFAYERITDVGRYPVALFWAPNRDYASMHVLGQAAIEQGYIRINERMVTSQGRRDDRLLLSTLVHELIHIQGGTFAEGRSEDLESATQSATLEVLAAMCNYGEELACKSFWYELGNFAEDSLYVNTQNGNLFYQGFMDLFVRDSGQQRHHRKSTRFWADRQKELNYIIKSYGSDPWNNHVLPGIRGINMDTGHATWRFLQGFGDGEPVKVWQTMPFDDTRDMMGLLSLLVFWIK